MKKIRLYLCAVLLILSVAATTACSRNSGSDPSGQSSVSQSSSAAGKSSSVSRPSGSEESSGVLDGLMDDVEQGVHDLTGDAEGRGNNADESDNR